MNYSLTIEWNGTEVLFARCTAVMACDIVNGFFAGNFAGPDHTSWLKTNRADVGATLKCPVNAKAVFAYSDETGSARATVLRVAQ